MVTEVVQMDVLVDCMAPLLERRAHFNDIVVYLAQRRLERYKAGEELQGFRTTIPQDKNGKPNIDPMGEIAAEVSIMLNAGSDTTGNALINVFFWFLKNPECYQNLREELDSVLDKDEAVASFDKVKRLRYLRACLDESMRIIPPNTMSVNRLTPEQDMLIGGHWIPGNTTVHSPPYTMHRDPEVYPNTKQFIPERWLAEDAKDLQQHFIPFSGGARACIGRNITYLEQTVMMASLVHRHDFELLSPDFELTQREGFTWSPGDMPVRIRMRKDRE